MSHLSRHYRRADSMCLEEMQLIWPLSKTERDRWRAKPVGVGFLQRAVIASGFFQSFLVTAEPRLEDMLLFVV